MKTKPKETNGLKSLSDANGLLVMTFSGRSGIDHSISIPTDAIGPLVGALLHAAKRYASPPAKEGEQMQTEHAFLTKRAEFGGDASGQRFALSLTTIDDLQLVFLLQRDQSQKLADNIQRALFPGGEGQPTSTSPLKQ